MYFIKQLVHFLLLQYADYYTYKLVDLLLSLVSRIGYTGPPGFSVEEEEATGATEAVLGLPRVGGTAALGATLPKWGFKRSLLTTSTLSPTCSFQALFPFSNTL